MTNDDIDQLEYFVSTLFMRTLTFSPLKSIAQGRNCFYLKESDWINSHRPRMYIFIKCYDQYFSASSGGIHCRSSLSVLLFKTGDGHSTMGNFPFLWSELPDVVKGCWDTFVKCNCKVSNCTRNCPCKKMNEPCTSLCGCNCYN